MSQSCQHATKSAWDGPSSRSIMANRGNRSALLVFTVNGKQLLVRVLASTSESQIDHSIDFHGVTHDGRYVVSGTICFRTTHRPFYKLRTVASRHHVPLTRAS